MPGRPLPGRPPMRGFRLNAPQAESQAEEGSGMMAGLGDEIDDAFVGSNQREMQPPVQPEAAPDAAEKTTETNDNSGAPRTAGGITPPQAAQYQGYPPPTNGPYQGYPPPPPGGYPYPYPYPYPPPPQQPQQRLPLRMLICIGIFVIFLLIGLVIAVILTLGGSNNNEPVTIVAPAPAPVVPAPPTFAPVATLAPTVFLPPVNVEPTPEPKTTLGRVFQRGTLRCGVSDRQPGFSEINPETGAREGFDVEMCRAIAAAVFGTFENKVEFIPVSAFDRFASLADDSYDVLVRATTHTMEREVMEPTSGQGFAFSIPYLYNGLVFAGHPDYVGCADNFTIAGPPCQDLIICAEDGTTHVDIISHNNPGIQVVAIIEAGLIYPSFIQGTCNVIAGEQYDVAEKLVRERGYTGPYEYGVNVHSKEPLAFVTRDDDPEWSDFVNWVLQSLMAAEEQAISQQTANIIQPTTVWGENSPFRFAFRNAVRAVGHYGEIYERTLLKLLPRTNGDKINKGDTGLVYSFPFGDPSSGAPDNANSPTLDEIRGRGFLKCGISTRIIFAQMTNQTWEGFDVDFCKALSAAIFDGETDTVQYMDLPASERFIALANGDVDVLSRLTTVTLARDVNEPATGQGFSFTQPNFYDGLIFSGIPPHAGCADRLDVTSISCRDLKICVMEGTTFEKVVKEVFPSRFIVTRPTGEVTIRGLLTGECNVIAGGVVDVSLTNVRQAGYQGPYQVGTARYSKDPLALVTREDDPQWSKFVFWIVSAIFYAEEEGITEATAFEMPDVTLFGPQYQDMFRLSVGAVGNYGDIYERNAQSEVTRGGLNELNTLLKTPQHYPLPGTL